MSKSEALAHLTVMERTYNIKIKNKEEVAEAIAEKALETGVEPIHICTAINTWLAQRISQGEVEENEEIEIPRKMIENIRVKE
ncbi:MAG: hypothetical protein ACXQTC_00285 [Methanopyraceae archaeon]